MEMKDIKEKNEKDLLKILDDKKEELRSLRFGGAGSKNRNVKLISSVKKNIARVLTVINSK